MHNPSCGDTIKIHARVEENKVRDICFEGNGCALSTASASLLTESVKGKTISEIQKYTATDVLALLNIEVTPARMKCALLPLEAIQEAINSRQ
jgi:nitrogen fixation NifU-like protein